jgi:hypothetical protein
MKTFCFQLLKTFILSGMLVSSQVFAATLIVTNAADNGPGTLRERIASANPGDSITIIGGTPILLSSPLFISKNLQIHGSGTPGFRVSGNNQTRVFDITGGTVEMFNLTVADGRATGTNGAAGVNGETVYGGGIFVADGATLRLTKCILTNNTVIGGQGGSAGEFGDAGNGGNGYGGAIASLGSLSILRSTLKGNTANGGTGGVSAIEPGTGGQGWGGAVYAAGNATISRCTLHLNNAVAGPGGGGPGGGAGGAIYNLATMTVATCTIVSNSASGSTFDFGGGIDETGTLIVRDSTIVGNQADYGGGVTGGNYQNTIIAGNDAASGPDATGPIHSSDFNLIQNTNTISFTGTIAWSIFGQDPKLGPLQDNGAADLEFTPPNMAPLPGSPVIDKGGHFYDIDQRNYPRPYDTSIPNVASGGDIGAIEVHPTILVVTNNNNAGAGSLRQAVLDNNNLGGGNTITFATNVTGTIVLSGSELVIDTPTTIVGPGADVLAVSGNNSVRVFSVLSGPSQITGLTICNGLNVGSAGSLGQHGFDGRGAGIYNQHTLLVSGCTIRSNLAVGGMGGAANQGMVGNGGKAMGAGVYNANGTLSLQFCSLDDNRSVGGQGGNAPSGEAGTGGNALGGAISTGGGSLILGVCSFHNNVAEGGAGGIGATPGIGGQANGAGLYTQSPTTATYTTFGAGRAIGGSGGGGNGSGYGGGIYNLATNALFLCTIASNSVSGSSFDFGGGIYNLSALGLTNVTIAGNQADYGGGLHGDANAANSLIGANLATTSDSDVSGTINSFDYNLIQTFAGLNIIGSTANVIIGQNPLLGPLTNNGGFARTMALRPGSPAIDKGKNFSGSTDQRGAPRPFDIASIANANGGDGNDIGAFELGFPVLKISHEQSNVILRWPDVYGDFVLESTHSLTPPIVWNPVPLIPVIGPAEHFYVTNSAASGNELFRLKNR